MIWKSNKAILQICSLSLHPKDKAENQHGMHLSSGPQAGLH